MIMARDRQFINGFVHHETNCTTVDPMLFGLGYAVL
jgi:hypothetical protein